MTLFLLWASVVLLCLSFLIGLYRIDAGPSLLDRILGFDAMTIALIGIIMIIMIREKTPHFLETLLIFSLLGRIYGVSF
jgi:multisubunit Na+/H+ antiporter MnhF subunit